MFVWDESYMSALAVAPRTIHSFRFFMDVNSHVRTVRISPIRLGNISTTVAIAPP